MAAWIRVLVAEVTGGQILDSGSGSIIRLIVVSEGLKGVKDDPRVLELTAGGAELSFLVYGDEDRRRSRLGGDISSGVDKMRFLLESLM